MKNVLTGIRPFGSLLAIAGHRTVSYVLQPIGVNSRNSCQKLCTLRLWAKFCVCLARWPTVQPGGCHWPAGATRQNQKSSFIAIFRFKGIQSYSKQFKAIQGFLETFFYFYAPPRYDNVLIPTEWSFDLLWCLEVGSWSFCHGGIRKVLRQPLPSYARLRQPMPATPLPPIFWPIATSPFRLFCPFCQKSVFYLCPSVAQKSDRFLIFNFVL